MGNKASELLRDLNISKQSVEIQKYNLHKMWPFSANLPRQLNTGDKIIIEGKIADEAELFSLNLVCEHDENSKPYTVAYHHKILFNEEKTILNSKQDGVWLEEIEESADLTSALFPGEEFHIMLNFNEDAIFIYFNRNYHSSFEHRIPMEDIKYLQIWDGLDYVKSMTVEFSH